MINDDDYLHCGLEIYPEPSDLEKENVELREEIDKLKKESRKYLPTLAELLDRLTITQIKEVKIPEHKDKYAQEIKEIMHDIDLLLENVKFDAKTLRALVIISQYNLHIWHNEANFRKGIKEGNDLELTHSLNGVRNRAKNVIQDSLKGRQDYKVDCLAAEHSSWEPSW
jgi:hypothetical protein